MNVTLAANVTLGSRLRYDPWGKQRYAQNVTPTGYRYTAQRFDDKLGLYDYNAHYYDPAIGRFLSADTIVPSSSNPQSFNRYTYVFNNPLLFTDPSGHIPYLFIFFMLVVMSFTYAATSTPSPVLPAQNVQGPPNFGVQPVAMGDGVTGPSSFSAGIIGGFSEQIVEVHHFDSNTYVTASCSCSTNVLLPDMGVVQGFSLGWTDHPNASSTAAGNSVSYGGNVSFVGGGVSYASGVPQISPYARTPQLPWLPQSSSTQMVHPPKGTTSINFSLEGSWPAPANLSRANCACTLLTPESLTNPNNLSPLLRAASAARNLYNSYHQPH